MKIGENLGSIVKKIIANKQILYRFYLKNDNKKTA